MKVSIKNSRQFSFIIIAIAWVGFFIRFVNVNYSSLWADELYSAMLANPRNSWYEVLYLQRAYQPPLYAFILWVWVKIFAYNEFYIRLLTVLAGTASIVVSGFLGKKIKDERLGIILAVIVAFNPVQIWYSLEARFYAFVYLFAALSLLIYWHLLIKKPKGWFIYFLKGIVDATLCYFHHFGILFIFAQFVYDVYLLYKEKDKAAFLKKLAGYAWAGILYAPWILWGITEGMAVKQYWLKEVDVLGYLSFNIGNIGPSFIINLFALLLIAFFFWYAIKQRNKYYALFPFICFIVTLIPVIYSYIKMPLLVDRYAMVMAPVLYVMMAIGFYFLASYLNKYSPALSFVLFAGFMIIMIWPGINESFINKSKLRKQPWREMGEWLNNRPDYSGAKIYSQGAFVKKEINIDFYLNGDDKALGLAGMHPGEDKKMYLVETNSVWKIKDSVFNRLDSFYTITQVRFNKGEANFGNIYICEKK